MKRLRILGQLIRADFLERTRRYSFFITLALRPLDRLEICDRIKSH